MTGSAGERLLLAGATIGSRAIGLVWTILLVRAFGVAVFGEYSFAFAVASFGGVVIDGPVGLMTLRATDDAGLRRHRVVRLAVVVAGILIGVAAWQAGTGFAIWLAAFVLAGEVALGGTKYELQRRGRSAAQSSLELARPALSLVLAAVAIGAGAGVETVLGLYLAAYIPATLAGMFLLRHHMPAGAVEGPPVRYRWLLIGGLAGNAYVQIDIILLRMLASPSALGVYALASNIVWSLASGAASASLPVLRRIRSHDVLRRDLALFGAVGLGSGLAAAGMLRLVGDAVFDSPSVARETAPLLALMSLMLLLRFPNYLVSARLVRDGRERARAAATVVAAVVNVGANLLFIPRWGALGAAAAAVATEPLLTYLLARAAPKTLPSEEAREPAEPAREARR